MRLALRRRRWIVRLVIKPRVSLGEPLNECACHVDPPRTSSFNTLSRSSLTSLSPCRTCSFVWSRSLRAVATIGTLVVCSRRRASSSPMPRLAGVTSTHGCIVVVIQVVHIALRSRWEEVGHLDYGIVHDARERLVPSIGSEIEFGDRCCVFRADNFRLAEFHVDHAALRTTLSQDIMQLGRWHHVWLVITTATQEEIGNA